MFQETLLRKSILELSGSITLRQDILTSFNKILYHLDMMVALSHYRMNNSLSPFLAVLNIIQKVGYP